MIGFCLLGGGAALAFGSINLLYRISENAVKYGEILAPHLASVPNGGAYSTNADEWNQKFSIQIPSDDAFKLKFLQASSEGGVDIGTTRVSAIGGLILMGLGMRLSARPEGGSNKKQQTEQAGTSNGG